MTNVYLVLVVRGETYPFVAIYLSLLHYGLLARPSRWGYSGPAASEIPCPGGDFLPKPPAADWKGLYLAPGGQGVPLCPGHGDSSRVAHWECCKSGRRPSRLLTVRLWSRETEQAVGRGCRAAEKPLQLHQVSWRGACGRGTQDGPVLGFLSRQRSIAAAVLQLVPENKASLDWQLCRQHQSTLSGVSTLWLMLLKYRPWEGVAATHRNACVCSGWCKGIRSTAGEAHCAAEPPSWKSCLGSAQFRAVSLWPSWTVLVIGRFGPEDPAKHPCCWFESQKEVFWRVVVCLGFFSGL